MSRVLLSKSTFLKGEDTLTMLAVCHVCIILNLSPGSIFMWNFDNIKSGSNVKFVKIGCVLDRAFFNMITQFNSSFYHFQICQSLFSQQ